MKISIISDTHSYIDEQLRRLLADSDEIWHAGDIGNSQIIDELGAFSGNLRAVSGNIDDQAVRIRTHEYLFFNVSAVNVLLIHIGGTPPRYNTKVRALIAKFKPNILVCGHSHILKIAHDPQNKLLYINPGACGNHGFHKIRTMVQFEITNGMPKNMKVIELGKRGQLAV